MSQQRSCCCGPQQEFELECLHSDKMGYHSSPYKRNDVTAQGERGRENFRRTGLTYQKNTPFDLTTQRDGYRQGIGKNIDTVGKSGMGCLLCQGSMIMSFKAKAFNLGGMTQKGVRGCRNEGDGCVSFSTYFDGSNFQWYDEDQLHILYLAAKDFWYFERGPTGIPFSSFNFAISPHRSQAFSDGLYFDSNNVLGYRSTPEPAVLNPDCIVRYPHPIRPTDNDGLCHPELTYCTNPSNVVFGPEKGSVPARDHITKAYQTGNVCGDENNDPEFAYYSAISCPSFQKDNFVCAQLDSNVNERAQYGVFNGPCGGLYAPGLSSWQMYQMRKTPHLRSTADIISYGNGIRLFPAPGEAVESPIGELTPTQFSNALGAQYGTLYRVRMWVKADQHVNTGFEYPCTDSNGNRVAYYPPETNKKMQTSSSDGGYSPVQKVCSSGPAAILYSCSGAPVFSSDLRDMIQDPNEALTVSGARLLSDYYYGDLGSFGQVISNSGKVKHFECTKIAGGIEDILGESGRFVAKDWRQDQIQKYNELESEFQSKAAETLSEIGDKLTPQERAALTKYTTVSLPDGIKTHLDPLVGGDNQLLPIQKSGPEFLTMFIHRVGPKQLADEESADTLITEMPFYQGSKFGNGKFAIDSYDPWHPDNDDNIDWPSLGKTRQAEYPIILRSPDGRTGLDETFNFRYPVKAAYKSAFKQVGLSLTDEIWDEIAPKWERDLFEIWYKKNPVYFHASPGGWMWSGDGVGHQPGFSCPPDTPCVDLTTDACRWSNTLQKTGLIDSVHQLNFFDTGRARANGCDGFPNCTRLIKLTLGAGFVTQASQLRNRPRKKQCASYPASCAYPGVIDRTFSAEICPEDVGDLGTSPCDIVSGPANIAGSVGNVCDPDQFKSGGGEYCTIVNGAVPNPTVEMINCCSTAQSFYAGSRRGSTKFAKGTSAILNRSPKTINENSTREEIHKWNKENPSVMMGDPSFYGIRCTERGNCPNGYECCCPSGCDDDCFCIPLGNECVPSPCSSANRFNSDCCAAYGSCCYTDSDGRLRCIDNVSNEECIARTELGGLNGTFYKDTTCSSGPCKTSVTTGACFYTDKLVDHQICRQTTQDTCTALSGEFFANQECSEFNDKITTGYETITSQVNNKPPYAGDRSCGRFGFSVNCCTEETNQETGVITRTCETKCISDCDIGENGTSRIVGTCTACAELGHCCDEAGYCDSRVTKEDCAGTWYPGEECDGESCISFSGGLDNDGPGPIDGGGGGGEEGDSSGCDCVGLLGPLTSVCTPPGLKAINVAGHNYPLPLDGTFPMGCNIGWSEAFAGCVTRHVQVTKMGFRHVIFSSSATYNTRCITDGKCNPTAVSRTQDCCGQAVNPLWCYDVETGCGDGIPGEEPEPLRPQHEALDSTVATFYPFKVRCQQVKDAAGFWKCQELSSYLFPSEITDYSYGIAGVNDHKTCHNFKNVPNYDAGCKQEFDPRYCILVERGGICIGDTDQNVTVGATTLSGNEQCIISEPIFLGADEINQASFCPSFMTGLYRAYSIPFLNDETPGDTQHLYAPSYGVGYIPKTHCLSSGAEKPLDSPFVDVPAGNVFHECAEYYNDKILSDLDEYYQEPLPFTELTFTDYGGVDEDDIAENVCAADLSDGGLANYFKDAKAEFVDANFGAKDNTDEFWVKKQFPQLSHIRLFGVGCYNFPGTYEGGRPNILGTNDDGTDIRAGGDFAGTMVMSFRTKEEFERYDSVYGSENLKLKFLTEVDGQPFPIGGKTRDYTFVAQPSYNIRIESDFSGCVAQPDSSQDCAFVPDEDNTSPQACSYGETGYLNGYGLKYASISNGTDVNNPDDPPYEDYPPYDPDKDTTVGRWGKVYEFCSFISPNDNPPQLDPAFAVGGGHSDDSGGQLKPFFTLSSPPDSDTIPKFSGLRGPLVLLSTERFTVDLSRFDDVIENNSCGICYTELGDVATGYCEDSDGNRTTASTRWQCLGLDNPDTATGRCCTDDVCTVTTEAECTGDWTEGADCSFVGGQPPCGGGIGLPPAGTLAGNGNVWFDLAPSEFTKELCLAPDIGGAPTSSYTWYPSVEGITNGGAFGCCVHETINPNGTSDKFTCPEDPDGGAPPPCFPFTPCNSWQDRNTLIHANPARTFGAGECWSGDGCS